MAPTRSHEGGADEDRAYADQAARLARSCRLSVRPRAGAQGAKLERSCAAQRPLMRVTTQIER